MDELRDLGRTTAEELARIEKVGQAIREQRADAWLVLLDRGGLFAAYLDEQRARRAAEDVDGILVGPLPIAADYRPSTEDGAE